MKCIDGKDRDQKERERERENEIFTHQNIKNTFRMQVKLNGCQKRILRETQLEQLVFAMYFTENNREHPSYMTEKHEKKTQNGKKAKYAYEGEK